jgi:hypothetical protein
MNDFLKSPMGKKFYERDVPALITQLQRLGDILESIQKEQAMSRVEEKRKSRIDQKKMIAETVEAYIKAKNIEENAKD